MNQAPYIVTRLTRLTTAVILLIGMLACDDQPANESAPAPEPALLPIDCSELEGLRLVDVQITAIEAVEGSLQPPLSSLPAGNAPLQVPPFCRLSATIAPEINFEVWLPQDWNGKYQGVGNGGMAGRISYAAMAAALHRGYATASTDTGHRAGPIAFDASWAAGRPDLIEDFGHRALHLTTVHAKRVIAAFYGRGPEFSYYQGCSKGGQQGLMEVQRYPEDFDGVIAGNPAHDWTRFYAGAHLWYSLATLSDPESYLPADKLPRLGEAVNAACDAADGIADGIIQDPRSCAFDPDTLACANDQTLPACLTRKQVTAVKKIYSGVTDSTGKLIFPGLVPGGEASPGGWALWVTGEKPFSSLHWLGGEGFFRHFVFEDPQWDFRTFDYDADLAFALEKVGAAVDANDPDLRPFRDQGGKLIVYHGWSDADISPLAAIDYFEQVIQATAADQAPAVGLGNTQDFFRLFMVPGLGHCRGGPGTDQFDALTALERWVEDGVAPEQILASKLADNAVVMTRPLCPYPQTAVWNGQGDTNQASSFDCESP